MCKHSWIQIAEDSIPHTKKSAGAKFDCNLACLASGFENTKGIKKTEVFV